MNSQVNIPEWCSNGLALYRDNFLLLVLVGLIVFVLSFFSIGILAGPSIAGAFLITLSLIREPSIKPAIGDIFKGFDFFKQTFLFVITNILVLIIGSFILSILPVFLEQIAKSLFFISVMIISQFGILLIVDKKMSFQEAFIAGIKKGKELYPFLFAFTLIWMILSWAGSIIAVVGIFFTMPIAFCMISYAYLNIFK